MRLRPRWDDLWTLVRSMLAKRWVRFGVVGGLATLVYFLLGLLFVNRLAMPVLLGNALAYVLSFAVSYLGQSRWTFEATGRHSVMLPRFAATQAVGLVLNSIIIAVLVHLGVSYEWAMPIAAASVPLCVYLICKYWVFRVKGQQAGTEGSSMDEAVPLAAELVSAAADAGVDRQASDGASEGTAGGRTGDRTDDVEMPVVARWKGADAEPAVSVIMNCLNCEENLAEALDSLRSQTFQDFEIIFWDNGSADRSPDLAQAYGPQLRYFRAEQTVPLGAARNLALTQARGRYLAFLDCDDVWLPEKLAAQVRLFEANARVGLVSTDTEIFDGHRVLKRLFAESAPERGMVFTELMQRQWISMSSAMIRREALAGLAADPALWQGGWFDESLNVCEEADVFYRIAHDWELDHVDAPLTRWRVHGQNTTFRKFGQFADETLLILAKQRSLYADYDVEHADLVALLIRRAAFQKAVALWREGRGADARVILAPWRRASRKHVLFWWASYLPGACFDLAARAYFALPAALRR